jgi:hypothetical protein
MKFFSMMHCYERNRGSIDSYAGSSLVVVNTILRGGRLSSRKASCTLTSSPSILTFDLHLNNKSVEAFIE